MESILKLQAQFIIDNINRGMSYESALEKSFLDINEFLNNQMNSSEFKERVFSNVLNIINYNPRY